MKHLLLLGVFAFSTLLLKDAHADDAQNGSLPPKGIFVVNIDQGQQGTAMLLSGLSTCSLLDTKFLCGEYADQSWLTGKKIYINPARIDSVYVFSSLEEYSAAIKKYESGQSTGIMDRILGK